MRLQFLGSGDAFGSGGRFNTCFHLERPRHGNVLIDCGASSLVAIRKWGVDPNGISTVLVSHLHGDHFAGLPFFLLDAQFARRTRPLVIAGPEGIETKLPQAMEVMFEHSSKTQQKFEFSVLTLKPEQTHRLGAVKVTPYAVVHGASGGPFQGYRIEAEGRVIAYTADTEWTETLVPLGRGADLFIAEAYTFEKDVRNHLSLKALEAHLAEIAPKRLILTHMSDDMLSRLDGLAHESAQDGMIVEV